MRRTPKMLLLVGLIVSTVLLVTLVRVEQTAQVPAVTEPPMPDFETRVDYAEWFKSQLKFAEEDNAYEEYRQFMEDGHQPVFPASSKNMIMKLAKSARPWRASEYSEVAAWLDEIDPQLEAYVKGTEYQFYVSRANVDDATLFEAMLPNIVPSYRLSIAMLVKAWQAHDGFGADMFVRRLEIINGHANHLAQGITMVDHLMALTIKQIVYRSVAHAIAADLLSESRLATLLSVFQADDSQDFSAYLNRSLYTDLAMAYDTLQDLCSTNGKLQPKISSSAVKGFGQPTAEVNPILKELGLTVDQLNLIVRDDPRVLSRQSHDFFTSIMETCERSVPKDIETIIEARVNSLVKESVFHKILLPRTERVFTTAIRVETRRRGTQLLLALALHKEEHGIWPERLDALSPLPKRGIRIDPRSGRDFIYRADGDTMMLYSVGMDGVDNGGTLLGEDYRNRDGEDLVIWPVGP